MRRSPWMPARFTCSEGLRGVLGVVFGVVRGVLRAVVRGVLRAVVRALYLDPARRAV